VSAFENNWHGSYAVADLCITCGATWPTCFAKIHLTSFIKPAIYIYVNCVILALIDLKSTNLGPVFLNSGSATAII